jgi:hypothetical protein
MFVCLFIFILHLFGACNQELWREAFGFTDDICKGLRKAGQRKDSLQINPDIVTDTVAMVLRHHYLSGVSMGGKILRALKEEEFGRFSSLTRLLLSPTVFDGFVGGAAQASTDLDYVLSNAKVSTIIFVCLLFFEVKKHCRLGCRKLSLFAISHLVCGTASRLFRGFRR